MDVRFKLLDFFGQDELTVIAESASHVATYREYHRRYLARVVQICYLLHSSDVHEVVGVGNKVLLFLLTVGICLSCSVKYVLE